MKKLINLKGVKALNKENQKVINGGAKQKCCDPNLYCCTTNPPPSQCVGLTWGNSNCQYLYSTGCCI